MVVEQEDQTTIKDVTFIERQDLSMETLGLTLDEAKLITSEIQKTIAEHQTEDYIYNTATTLPTLCAQVRLIKGYHSLKYRTIFGKLVIRSPRLYECNCHAHKHISFSPLALLLSERTSPELNYLESKWASLMSYGMTTNLLEEVLPLETHHSSVMYNAQQVATRLEQELEKEQYMFIDGCENELRKLLNPGAPLIVGMDGGYVHAREGNNRKAGWFEAIVGKSFQENREAKRFGSVVDYDKKPKRRIYEVLRKQGLQMNQAVTFLSDGGDKVRDLQYYLSFNSEHILDWFHITMKLTVMTQMAKGLPIKVKVKTIKEINRVKWYLWHSNVYKALRDLESLLVELESLYFEEKKDSKGYKVWKATDEFYEYINSNSELIPNYGNRYRHGEVISTAFIESTVNELISKRMAKKQQMRWTKRGAHLLLQLRVKTLDKELRQAFCNWYPKMQEPRPVLQQEPSVLADA